MRLYLMRHGAAVSGAVDSQRPLSDSGRAEVRRLGQFLQSRGDRVVEIQHSTLVRAAQTAAIMSETWAQTSTVLEREGLAPEDSVAATAEGLRHETRDILLVSHLPYLPMLAARLLQNTSSRIGFATAGMMVLEGEGADWSLLEQLDPRRL